MYIFFINPSSLMSLLLSTQNTIYKHCDPVQPVNGDCPSSHCCVRDEFELTLVYCEQIGQTGDGCSVRPSVHDCPCAAGLLCRPNIKTAVFQSMFGRCSNQTAASP